MADEEAFNQLWCWALWTKG